MTELSDFADLLNDGDDLPCLVTQTSKSCPCGGGTTRHGGNMVCSDCGSVIQGVLDVNDEYRNAASIKDTERCHESRNIIGEEPTLHNIGFAGMSNVGNKVQKTATWSNATSRQRMFQGISQQLMDLAKLADLPDVVAKTMTSIYHQVYLAMESRTYGIKRNNVTKCLLAGCFFFACVEHDCPRELKEIAEILDIQHKMVSTGRNLIIEVLGGEYARIPPLKVTQFVPRFVTMLNIPWDLRLKIVKLAEIAVKHHIMHECSPTSVCAGIIYASCHNSPEYMAQITPLAKDMAKDMAKDIVEKHLLESVSKVCRVSKTVVLRVSKQLTEKSSLLIFE